MVDSGIKKMIFGVVIALMMGGDSLASLPADAELFSKRLDICQEQFKDLFDSGLLVRRCDTLLVKRKDHTLGAVLFGGHFCAVGLVAGAMLSFIRAGGIRFPIFDMLVGLIGLAASGTGLWIIIHELVDASQNGYPIILDREGLTYRANKKLLWTEMATINASFMEIISNNAMMVLGNPLDLPFSKLDAEMSFFGVRGTKGMVTFHAPGKIKESLAIPTADFSLGGEDAKTEADRLTALIRCLLGK